MGKKKQKKVKGAEKTAMKTEKKLEKKAKKALAEQGEEDIERMIAEFQDQDRRKTQVIEEKCKPTPRCNMSLTANPDKDELVMFGGEYFNGSKMFMYNDLFFYNIKKNEWTKLTVPNGPPPRSAHQAVALKQGGGQLWIFGGEFASPTQSQFYHYKDLWMFNFKEKSWQKFSAPGAPSARSGHRMVAYRKLLVVFGGFHDNIRDYKYFNDVHMFNLETYQWTKVDVSGSPPVSRSGCQLAVTENNRIVLYGGYSKERVKRDVDKGVTHTDMFIIVPDDKKGDDPAPAKWKWQPLKQSGTCPSPRCGFSLATIPDNKAVLFGGVFDEEDTEEEVKGLFRNDMYLLELERGKWHEFYVRSKKDNTATEKKKRRRKDKDTDEADENSYGDDAEMQQDIENLKIEKETQQSEETTYDDGIFKVTVGSQSQHSDAGDNTSIATSEMEVDSQKPVFTPCARMNALVAVKMGQLYLYGGILEQGDKQITLDDFYCLDVQKQDEWIVLDKGTVDQQEWLESDNESGDDDDNDADDDDDDDDDDDEDDADKEEDDANEDEEMDAEIEFPLVNSNESLTSYFSRNKDFWLEFVLNDLSPDEQESTRADKIEQLAYEMCREIHKRHVDKK